MFDPISLAIMVAFTLVMNLLLQPKPKAADITQINFPTADEDRPVPVIWGTVRLDSPNLLWYGDFDATKRKALFGLITKGFSYSVGMQLGLCQGEATLEAIYANEKVVWTGSASNGTTLTIDKPELFGGVDREGGLVAYADFYTGSAGQNANPYLKARLTAVPAYKGTSYLVWNGHSSGKIGSFYSGYFGTTGNLYPMAFRMRRIPDNLPYTSTNYSTILGRLANPAEMIYELLTNNLFGQGLSGAEIDTASFLSAAQKLYTENFGLAAIWDSQQPVGDVITGILNTIDGTVYVDPATGLYTIALARDDYNAAALDVYDESLIDSVINFERNTYSETPNELRTAFTDIDQNFKSRPLIVQDLGNQAIQGQTVSITINHIGIADGTTCARVGARDLRALSLPLARADLRMFRGKASQLRPGSVFKWSNDELRLNEFIMRVLAVDFGDFEDGFIKVSCIEDVFAQGKVIYNMPAPTMWQPLDGTAQNLTVEGVSEIPFSLSQSDLSQVHAYAAKPSGTQFSFNLYTSQDGGSNYTERVREADFAPTGTLAADYPKITAAIDTSDTLEISPTAEMGELVAATATDVRQGLNLAYIASANPEWIAFEAVSLVSGNYKLNNVWRGLFDTVPQTHAAGSRIWFIGTATAVDPNGYAAALALKAKLTTTALDGESALASATALTHTIKQRSLRPIVPGNFKLNTVYNPVDVPDTGDITASWNLRDRHDARKVINQTDSAPLLAPEAGTTHVLKIYGQTGLLIHTEATLPGSTTSFIYTNAQETIDAGALQEWLTFVLYSKRDGLDSFNAQIWQVKRVSTVSSPPALPAYTPAGTYTGTPNLPSGNIPAGTDLGGTYQAPVVTGIQGSPVSATPPSVIGQTLIWDGTQWVPGLPTAAPGGPAGGDLSGTYPNPTVAKIQGRAVCTNAPTLNQFLGWNGSLWCPSNIPSSALTGLYDDILIDPDDLTIVVDPLSLDILKDG